jgi:hypothetical protein
MNARILVAAIAVLATTGGAQAGEMRAWTDCQGKTIEAKTEGFEQTTAKLSRKSGALIVDGVRYSRLGPAMKTALGLILRRNGFDDIDAAVPRDSTAVKEFSYTIVVLRSKDDRVIRAPLESLDGAENDTGDYRIALDESKSWLESAKRLKSPADANAQQQRDAEWQARQEAQRLATADAERRRREEADRLARQKADDERKNAESYKEREKRLHHAEDERRRQEQERLDRERKDQQAKADELHRREKAVTDAQHKERERLEKEKQELAKKKQAQKQLAQQQEAQKEREKKDREKKERERMEQEKKQQEQQRNKKH